MLPPDSEPRSRMRVDSPSPKELRNRRARCCRARDENRSKSLEMKPPIRPLFTAKRGPPVSGFRPRASEFSSHSEKEAPAEGFELDGPCGRVLLNQFLVGQVDAFQEQRDVLVEVVAQRSI